MVFFINACKFTVFSIRKKDFHNFFDFFMVHDSDVDLFTVTFNYLIGDSLTHQMLITACYQFLTWRLSGADSEVGTLTLIKHCCANSQLAQIDAQPFRGGKISLGSSSRKRDCSNLNIWEMFVKEIALYKSTKHLILCKVDWFKALQFLNLFIPRFLSQDFHEKAFIGLSF